MITEEQRRALFALREALHLCDIAGVEIINEGFEGNGIVVRFGISEWPCFTSLIESDLAKLLQEHPE